MFYPPDFDLERAKELALLCRYAYIQLECPNQFKLPIPYELLATFQDSHLREPFGFIAKAAAVGQADNVYVIFRGTVSVEDWLKDFEFTQTPYMYTPAPHAQVETGFDQIYHGLHSTIIQTLNGLTHAVAQVFVSGHSLGAALAVMAVPDICLNTKLRPVSAYTFAGPRVGNAHFAAFYNGLDVLTYRVVNTSDVVPSVPLPAPLDITVLDRQISLGGDVFTHVGEQISFTDQRGNITDNHILTTYAAALGMDDLPACS